MLNISQPAPSSFYISRTQTKLPAECWCTNNLWLSSITITFKRETQPYMHTKKYSNTHTEYQINTNYRLFSRIKSPADICAISRFQPKDFHWIHNDVWFHWLHLELQLDVNYMCKYWRVKTKLMDKGRRKL